MVYPRFGISCGRQSDELSYMSYTHACAYISYCFQDLFVKCAKQYLVCVLVDLPSDTCDIHVNMYLSLSCLYSLFGPAIV